MKSILLIIGFVIAIAVLAGSVAASEGHIDAQNIEGNIYQFTLVGVNSTAIRWTFGDGASSEELSPVHEFGTGVFSVSADANGTMYTTTVDTSPPLLDPEEGKLNIDDVSIPGGMLLLSCGFMLVLARTDSHPFADILGTGGKDVVSFFYALGVLAGIYLVYSSVWGVIQ